MQPPARRGLMLVLSSPSGAGKTTITRRLLQSDPSVTLSVSATTRAKRPSEVDGQDYHFVSPERFERMARAGEFLEHATVFGSRYGTPREPVEQALGAGRDVLFDVDWQGARQIREANRADSVLVFILPPSAGELENRLRTRAQDSDDIIRGRMAKAAGEIAHWDEYDFVVVNDDLESAFGAVQAILRAERLRRERGTGLPALVARLTADLGG